jgi:NADH-quinone oxidoreductase subunit N
MYHATPAVNMMKAILTFGTFIVVLQSRNWLNNTESKMVEGEFYMLTASTLLGMYMMMSAGDFLMFFLGLEMASVPMACMVALDKWRNQSAEAAAKFILTATFSSGVMLYGISFLYGATGHLYFDDFRMLLKPTNLSVMGMVFFIAGLGFKISLVPFHLWTADVYQGAPTAVTGYLSVISKGSAAFAFMVILVQVFGTLYQEVWQWMLYALIVLTITVGNLFAMRQRNLKRFLAFSSVSQAGYVMLGVIAANQVGMASMMYYILVYIFF